MNNLKILKIVLVLSIPTTGLTTGCSGSSSGSGISPSAETYSATLTEIRIRRTADQLDMPVNNTPVDGALITVQ